MLQEAHLSDSEHLKLNQDWVGQVYYSSFTAYPRKRGTIILINKHLPFIFENQISERTNSVWYNIEESACAPLPIRFLLFVKNYSKLNNISEHFTISKTCLERC